jgi:N-methylhydantoinase A
MFSALGLLTADLFHDYFQAFVIKSDDADTAAMSRILGDMESEGRETLLTEGVEPTEMRFLRQLDLRYFGQSYELSVDVDRPMDQEALRRGVESFHGRHEEIYGYSAPSEPVEIVNIRFRAVGVIPKPRLKENDSRGGEATPIGRRLVYFGGDSWKETPVYHRGGVPPGSGFEGPAIIEQYDATTVVYPGWDVTIDAFGILRLKRER